MIIYLLVCGSDGKESACNAGDLDSIPGLGRSPGEGNDNPLQYSCLENPMGRGAWQATVHGVAKSQPWWSFSSNLIILSSWTVFLQTSFIWKSYKPLSFLKWSHLVMSDFATPWTIACKAPLSMGFSRQEYWSGLPFPSPGDLPNPGIEPGSTCIIGRRFTLSYLSHLFSSCCFWFFGARLVGS